MASDFLNRFFPTPSFLSPTSFGLDISDDSLRFVELKRTRYGAHIGRHGEKKIPEGVVEKGKIKDPKRLAEILSELRQVEKIKSVHVSLSEEQIYLFPLK